MLSICLLLLALAPQAPPLYVSGETGFLSEDGKMLCTPTLGDRYLLPSWKHVKGDYVYYCANPLGAWSLTTSQRGWLANQRKLGAKLEEPPPEVGFHNEIMAQTALTATVLAVCFQEQSWRVPNPPKGVTNRSMWIAIVDTAKRGKNPNVGMRLLDVFVDSKLQFLTPEKVALTGWVAGPKGARADRVTVTAYELEPARNRARKLWSRRSGEFFLYDASGIVTSIDGKWRFVDGPSGKVLDLALDRKPEFFAGSKVFYREAEGTSIYNVRSRKKAYVKGFDVRIVSGTGAMMLGQAGAQGLVARATPDL